jgi:DNA polymerase-4
MDDAWPRIVAHADMDAFYAAVEQLDDPTLRGVPILVGPRSHRGVVLTASYEARPFRVGSAMPMAEARRRCPHAVIVPPRFDRYQALSEIIMSVFSDFSPSVEALSLDEAFLDMSGASHMFGPPAEMGEKIKRAVYEATGGLHVSVGVSGTKYVAKVASAHAKPDGLVVVPPGRARAWLAPMSVSRLWGAGPVTQQRLADLGLETIGDVAAGDPAWLKQELGQAGLHFHDLAHARDPRRVTGIHRAKSIGSERTLSADVSRRADIALHLKRSADKIARRLRHKRYRAHGVRVRLKTSSFRSLTRQRRMNEPTDVADSLYHAAAPLLDSMIDAGPFRLVGLAAYDLEQINGPAQSDLFAEDGRPRRLESTIDGLIERFGRDAVFRAADLSGDGSLGRQTVNLDFLDDDSP